MTDTLPPPRPREVGMRAAVPRFQPGAIEAFPGGFGLAGWVAAGESPVPPPGLVVTVAGGGAVGAAVLVGGGPSVGGAAVLVVPWVGRVVWVSVSPVGAVAAGTAGLLDAVGPLGPGGLFADGQNATASATNAIS